MGEQKLDKKKCIGLILKQFIDLCSCFFCFYVSEKGSKCKHIEIEIFISFQNNLLHVD